MGKAEEYYYGLLDKTGKQAYVAMKEGLLNVAKTFTIPRMDPRQVGEIYMLVRLDHPEIFYTNTFKMAYAPGNVDMKIMVQPEYFLTKKQIKTHQQALESRVKKIIRLVMDKKEEDKELYIHDFIIDHVTYDKLKKPYSHEIIGPLTNGVGVCEGIAKAVKILCDALGIWCIIAICDNNPEKKIKYRHTWNVIKIGGQYYHVDVTFDNSLTKKGEVVRYDYYNLDDGQIYRDHEPSMWKLPKCSDAKNRYYIKKKMSFTTQEEVRKRSAQAVKKGKVFLFHWRGGYLTKDILMDLMKIFKEEAEKKEKHAFLSLNWAQAVLCVSFKDVFHSEDIEMEDANEGEHYQGE